MRFERFLLDEWIERKFASGWRITHDFSSSAGPSWTVGEAPGRRRPSNRGTVSNPGDLSQCRWFNRVENGDRRRRGNFTRRRSDCHGGAGGPGGNFFAAARPGANVVLPHPGFPPFTGLPRGFGLEVRHYHLRAENSFDVDVDEVKSLCHARTALILLNSPHNPTESVAPEAVRRDVHDFCAERGIQFVCDQVCHPIYYGAGLETAAALPHATVLSDFSKALCLTGLRVGWIVERERERLEKYREARTYFTVSNSPVTEGSRSSRFSIARQFTRAHVR
jgi:hypothetical protein